MEQKETTEWSHTWFDHTDKNDLPRILLVGDSICDSYHEKVRELLKGVCYVDYFATSYAINLTVFYNFLKYYITDTHYNLIHFNNGLHGQFLTMPEYKESFDKVVSILLKNTEKVILAESTIVKTKGNEKPLDEMYDRVINKNKMVHEVAEKYNLPIDPFYQISCEIPNEKRAEDGWHYKSEGADILANQIVKMVKAELAVK